jgi:glycosyltransferase involved in cell wall biosynthesis
MKRSNHIMPKTDKAPRVSIGLPVFNGAAFLAEAIDALLAQTYHDFELIISDNASTDETSAICRAYLAKDRRIRYERQEVNRGLIWNWNRVFELSQGTYFKWTACDDLYHPTYLQKCVEILDQHPEVAWCHSLSQHIDASGNTLPSEKSREISHVGSDENPRSRCSRTSDSPSTRVKAILLGSNGLDCYGVMRSDVLRETSLYLPYYGAEKVLTVELALRGRYAEVPEVMYFARIHRKAAGNLHLQREQRRLMNPNSGRWRSDRLCLLRGHLAAVRRANLPVAERIRCYLAIARYLLQVRKWNSVLKKAVTGAGLAAEYPVDGAESSVLSQTNGNCISNGAQVSTRFQELDAVR